MAKKKKIKKLTPEQKKLVWEKPKSNAGAGWESKKEPTDPRHIDLENLYR